MALRELTATSAGLTIAATAYTDGDTLGTILTFTNAVGNAGGRGVIRGAVYVDAGDVLDDLDLYLFNASVTPAADNAAHALSDADSAKLVGVVRWATGDIHDFVNNKVGILANTFVPFSCAATSLYGVLVTRSGNAVFTAVGDITIRLYAED